MKKFLIGLAALTLTACGSGIETSKYNDVAKSDPAFADCIVKNVIYNGSSIIMARCPNSTTSVDFPYGKTRATSITVDDETRRAAAEYEKQIALIEQQEKKNALSKLTEREKSVLGIK
jgi:hypothetical protein